MLTSDFDRVVELNRARHDQLLTDAKIVRLVREQNNSLPILQRNSAIALLRAIVDTILHPQRFRSQSA
jgi:hypothetical protein